MTVDLALIAVSIFLVWSYMALYTGSLFIACFGMLQIFTSFAGANLLYRYAWPTQDGLGYNLCGNQPVRRVHPTIVH